MDDDAVLGEHPPLPPGTVVAVRERIRTSEERADRVEASLRELREASRDVAALFGRDEDRITVYVVTGDGHGTLLHLPADRAETVRRLWAALVDQTSKRPDRLEVADEDASGVDDDLPTADSLRGALRDLDDACGALRPGRVGRGG